MTNKNDVTIILPTLNEEKAVGPVIDELKELEYNNIIVIDGHSSDNTKQISLQKKVEFYEQTGKGKANALVEALSYVKTPYLLIMDCDHTYDPNDITKFLEKIEDVDEIIGARNLRSKNIPIFNQFGNSLITRVFNLVMGSDLEDVCSGMYMFKTEFLKNIEIKSKGYQVELDLAAKTGEVSKVIQVPVNYRARLGETKMSPVREGTNVFRDLFKFAKIYNPTLFFAIFAGFLVVPGLILLGWVGIRWLLDPFDFRPGITQVSIVLIIMGSNAIAFALISSTLRRLERKINSISWKNRK